MIFTKQYKELNANFICASDEYLKELELKEYVPDQKFKSSLWIWPTAAVRGHILRSFDIDFTPIDAYVEFVYDNKFDLFINGKEFSSECFGNLYRISLDSIADLLNTGTNRLALRLYQSASCLHFSAALRGGLFVHGEKKDLTVVTDDKFTAWLVCNFYEESEPCEWYNKDALRQRVPLGASKIHPKYLRRSMVFKKRFYPKFSIKKATLYATAKGLYEAYINEVPIDTAMFLPGSMEGIKEYQVFDVTNKIITGENSLGLITGNGWLNSQSWGWLFANKPEVLASLDIEYENGETETIKTDSSFEVYPSPIYENDIQFGERYDARLETCEEKKDSAFVSDERLELAPQYYPPVRITKTEDPQNKFKLSENTYIYDFGKNGTGRAKISIKNSKPGDVIKIRYAEFLNSDGTPHLGPYQEVYFPNDNQKGGVAEYSARNLDVYIARGEKTENYTPRFAFTGFRYVYIEDCPLNETDITVNRALMNTDLEEMGSIETSNEDIASIWDVVKRSYRSNIFTGPTDCPTREKNFWNGDIQVFAHTAMWYMNNEDFLCAWTHIGRKIQYNVYGWEDEEYILPLTLYKFYGNKEILEKKYEICTTLVKKRENALPFGEVLPEGKYAPYKDHKAIENVSGEFFAGAYHTYMYRCLAEMAKILKKTDDEKIFQEKFDTSKNAFNKRFYLKEKHDYNQNCQSGAVLPIAFGIAPEEDLPELMETVRNYVKEADYHFTTGFMAGEHLLGLLCDFGYEEDALKIILEKTYPSLLHMIGTGASTTTENWEGITEYDDIRQYDSMNHYAFGAPCRWFFEHLGGIKILKPGFKKILFKPTLYEELGNYSVSFVTPYGKIESKISYNKNDCTFTCAFASPKEIEAYVELPGVLKEKLNDAKKVYTVVKKTT